jgi:hypothetical protein
MRETYELLNGTHVEGLHREDVRAALAVFRTFESRTGRIECDEESLDAMARALAAARASREQREAADRQHERSHQQASRETAALLEVRRRIEARPVDLGSRLS